MAKVYRQLLNNNTEVGPYLLQISTDKDHPYRRRVLCKAEDSIDEQWYSTACLCEQNMVNIRVGFNKFCEIYFKSINNLDKGVLRLDFNERTQRLFSTDYEIVHLYFIKPPRNYEKMLKNNSQDLYFVANSLFNGRPQRTIKRATFKSMMGFTRSYTERHVSIEYEKLLKF